MKIIKRGDKKFTHPEGFKLTLAIHGCPLEEYEFHCSHCGCEFTCDELETINLPSEEVRLRTDEKEFNSVAFVRCPQCAKQLKKLLEY